MVVLYLPTKSNDFLYITNFSVKKGGRDVFSVLISYKLLRTEPDLRELVGTVHIIEGEAIETVFSGRNDVMIVHLPVMPSCKWN